MLKIIVLNNNKNYQNASTPPSLSLTTKIIYPLWKERKLGKGDGKELRFLVPSFRFWGTLATSVAFSKSLPVAQVCPHTLEKQKVHPDRPCFSSIY